MNTSKPVPTINQLEFLKWEVGCFYHFVIRTFYDGHIDWDMKPMGLEGFNPKNLDCNEWIETAKKAGANYAVLVAPKATNMIRFVLLRRFGRCNQTY